MSRRKTAISSSDQLNQAPSQSNYTISSNDHHHHHHLQPSTLVDLRLASTYIPACNALFKATCLILAVAHIHADDHRIIAILILLCVPLYIDKILTQENIFDCNSMLCTLHASYMINAIRHILGKGMFLAAAVDMSTAKNGAFIHESRQPNSYDDSHNNVNNNFHNINVSNNGSSRTILAIIEATPVKRHYHIHWDPNNTTSSALENTSIASAIINGSCIMLWIISIFLLTDRELFTTSSLIKVCISGRLYPPNISFVKTPNALDGSLYVCVCVCILIINRSYLLLLLLLQGVVVRSRGITVIMQAILLGIYIQTPLFEGDKPTTTEFIVRSYLFVVLCLAWIYVVGVRHMVMFLSTCTRLPSITIINTKLGKVCVLFQYYISNMYFDTYID